MHCWTVPTIWRRRRCTIISSLAILVFLVFGGTIVKAYSPRPDDAVKRRQQVYLEQEQRPLENFQAQPYIPVSILEKQLPLISPQGEAQLPFTDDFSLPYNTLPLLLDALGVMQSHFFELWLGTWPRAIDWTAAVVGTHISATLSTFTKSLDYIVPYFAAGSADALSAEVQAHENLINRYLTQLTSFYFGENAFSLRMQAYDDMLWVVLGWLESVKFIGLHMDRHYIPVSSSATAYNSSTWYAAQFIPLFAHRARLFYDLASQGWNTSLCGGGMIWSPYLTPYKNAITNELFIAASVSMYLYFPGDQNSSPFSNNQALPAARPHDPAYLKAAIDGYKWLSTSNMTNRQGLFTDGYHIRGWRGGRTNNTIGSGKCDLRNEMVYTYNQGVVLSGLRGLWESTGARSYLEDGHILIRSVVAATGWHVKDAERRRTWAGLGRNGILEEACDASGMCSQNGQTFKGIFFHHLSLFCAPLPTQPSIPGITFAADSESWELHESSCKSYVPWLSHNAAAAYRTRDEDGVFGMWWLSGRDISNSGAPDHQHDGAVDYRNIEVPNNEMWRMSEHGQESPKPPSEHLASRREGHWDWNDRGRGRTVETQSGGVAVLRALYELVHR